MLTCGAWIKRGAAKELPDKVTLGEEDLKQLVEETKNKLQCVDGHDLEELNEFLEDENGKMKNGDSEDEDEDDEAENNVDNVDNGDDDVDQGIEDDDDDAAIRAEYGLDDYDDEGAVMTGAGLQGLMYFNSNDEDPYINIKDLDEDERGDSMINKNDNLFVTGRMEEDYNSLDVYLYNEEAEDLFVHHDILLESFPLCVEWLSFEPGAEDGNLGNFVAVGTMEPEIQIWDLDIIDTIEPAFILGKKKKKKKKKKVELAKLDGHTDAVLGLAWNKNVPKIMASASADKTVCLWDMSVGSSVHSLKFHRDKVQSIAWHPVETQSLLSGSFDKTAVVVDCRSPDVFKSWSISGECEQVLWDHHSPYNFFVTSDDGVVSYYDVRTDLPVFRVDAHDKEVTGISLSKDIPNCFTTVSADERLKVWGYQDHKPLCILSRDMNMGGLHYISSCPDSSLTYAVGGQKGGLRMIDLLETSQGKEHFKSLIEKGVLKPSNKSELKGTPREIRVPDESPEDLQDATMDTDNTAEALSTLSIEKPSQNDSIVKRKKKKKKN